MWWLCVNERVHFYGLNWRNGINTLCDDFHLVIKATPIQIYSWLSTLHGMRVKRRSKSKHTYGYAAHTERNQKHLLMIMTFVASNIAKSINLLRQVLVHTIPTARHPKYQSKYFKCRKNWFSHCSMHIAQTHARRQQHSNYNNSWLQEKLYISIEYELSVFTFSNDCFVYSKHGISDIVCVCICLYSFTKTVYCSQFYTNAMIFMQWFDKNIHILPHFCMVPHSLLNFHTTIHNGNK